METYFDNIQAQIARRITVAKRSIKIAVSWFTNHELFDVVLEKLNEPNFEVVLIVLNDLINNRPQGLDFQKLIDSGGSFYYCNDQYYIHHKVCIIDDEIVITGSYNWTYYAENRNWENVICVKDPGSVKEYVNEFNRIIALHHKNERIDRIKSLKGGNMVAEYIENDLTFQAKYVETKGDVFEVAKIYDEIYNINRMRVDLLEAKKTIIRIGFKNHFYFSPFEIGIKFHSGYIKAIPAFTLLPYEKKEIIGKSPKSNLTALLVIIQKNDHSFTTIKEFVFDYLKPTPINTPKIEISLLLTENGLLKIFCKELNGYNMTHMENVQLRDWL